jgi:ornithine carbamoyltransferase
MPSNHFLTIADQPAKLIDHMLKIAFDLREQRDRHQVNQPILANKTLAMLFEKPSLRTRVSFEQAMYELGGKAIVLGQHEVGLGKREAVGDVARVLSGMVHGIAARVFDHEHLIGMSQSATVPVINMLSDRAHPAQALADAMTLIDEFAPGDRDLSGRTLVFVGDGNNVAASLASLSAKLGMRFILSAPKGYELDRPDVELISDPHEAVKQADAIYCDTFVSMGEEGEKERKLKAFENYQVNWSLLGSAPAHAIVLHCLPAYRGIEITDQVLDGPRCRAFSQAHNRLHAQKGLLAVLMAGP